jgi:hypothetical protein
MMGSGTTLVECKLLWDNSFINLITHILQYIYIYV